MGDDVGSGGDRRTGGGRDKGTGREAAVERVKEALVGQALEDPELRALALEDPAGAVRRLRSLDPEDRLPEGVRLRVVEERADRLYLVLPHGTPSGEPDREDPRGCLVARAAADPEFGRRLATEPRATVEELFAVDVPEGIALEVLQERADERVVVLPVDDSARVSADAVGGTDFQAAAWPADDCDKSFLGSVLVCPPKKSDIVDPFCTTTGPFDCPPGTQPW